MAKKAIFYEEAEKLYVIEQNTLEDIQAKLPVSERTLRTWKADGDWDTKRIQYSKSGRGMEEALRSAKFKIIQSIDYDLDRKEVVEGIRKTVNFEKYDLLIAKENLTIEDIVRALISSGFTLELLLKIIEYARAGDVTVSDTRINFIAKMSLMDIKTYEESKRMQSETKADTPDLPGLSYEELRKIEEILERAKGQSQTVESDPGRS